MTSHRQSPQHLRRQSLLDDYTDTPHSPLAGQRETGGMCVCREGERCVDMWRSEMSVSVRGKKRRCV